MRTGIFPPAIGFQTGLKIYYWNKTFQSYMNEDDNFFINDLAEAYTEYDLASDDKIIISYEDIGPLKTSEAYWLKNFLTPFEDELVYIEFKKSTIEICYLNQFKEQSIISIPRPDENWGVRTEPGKRYKWDELF